MGPMVDVHLSVPEEHVARVYAFVAELIEGKPARSGRRGADAPGPKSADRPPVDDDPAVVGEQYLGGRSDHWRPFLDLLASYPDEWLEWQELCEELELTPAQASGMLGAAERRCRRRPPYWKAQEDGTFWFRMPLDVAQVVRGLSGG